MIILGLTGSIGMGKSTAAAMLRRMGVPVHDADAAVHKALARGGAGVLPVAGAFPQSYDRASQSIDRKKLGALVFGRPRERALLESLLHPLVHRSQHEFLERAAQQNAPVVVLDIPLLFETGAESRVDYTLCLTAPYAIQRARVLARPGMTEARFHAVLGSQMPDDEKRARADFVVSTACSLHHTRRLLWQIIRQLRIEQNTGR